MLLVEQIIPVIGNSNTNFLQIKISAKLTTNKSQ